MLRVFAFSQGKGFSFFHQLLKEVSRQTEVGSISHFLSDRRYYESKIKPLENVIPGGIMLTEWEIISKGFKRRVTPEELAEWEKRLNRPSLWPALFADRRFINGLFSKFTQDYRPQYTHEEMQGIIVELLETVWKAFDEVQPNLVLSFSASTLGCYVCTWIAEARNVVCLNVKSTKISNYVTLSTDIIERHQHIREAYSRSDAPTSTFADEFLKKSENSQIVYEGTILRKKDITVSRAMIQFSRQLLNASLETIRHDSIYRDPQYYPNIRALWYSTVVRAARIRKTRSITRSRTESSLKNFRYVFFPLNSEPEIALSVYAPHFSNQIEVARNIAMSLPMGWKLVIKDHPRSKGVRKPGYYKKLMEIPNVLFIDIDHPMRDAISHCEAVVVISSFVGFEAIMQGKPVITLGFTPYEILPETMIKRANSTEEISFFLAWFRNNYSPDRQSLTRFISTVIANSCPLDLYSEVLKKSGREKGALNANNDTQKQISDFATYLIRRFNEEQSR